VGHPANSSIEVDQVSRPQLNVQKSFLDPEKYQEAVEAKLTAINYNPLCL